VRGSAEGDLVVVALGDIRVPEGRTSTPSTVEILKESIARVGVINPITVTRDGYAFDLVAGMNRLTACLELGMSSAPVIVLADGEPVREIEADENWARAHLTKEQIEESKRCNALLYAAQRKVGKSQRGAAKEAGVSRTTAQRSTGPVGPVEQPPAPKVECLDGKVRPAERIEPEAKAARQATAQAMKEEGATVRQIAAATGVSVGTAAADLKPKPAAKPRPEVKPEVKQMAALRKAWDAASESVRAEFVESIKPAAAW
jgi:ParB-like chromosome segregation protein Spo0J